MRLKKNLQSFLFGLCVLIVKESLGALPTGPNALYQILKVSPRAKNDEIKKAFRKLSLEVHPDRNKSPDAAAKFADLAAAYEILSDEKKRGLYDKYGLEGMEQREQGGFGEGQGGFHPFADMFDMFGHMHGPPRKQGKQKAEKIVLELGISLNQFYLGDTVNISYNRREACGKADSCVEKSPSCIDDGVRQLEVNSHYGIQVIQRHDRSCIARGHQWKSPCKVCPKGPYTNSSTSLKVDIGKGAQPGERLLFEGHGHENVVGYTGDLVLILKEVRRKGDMVRGADNRLTTKVSLTLEEALLGVEKAIPNHPSGDTVILDTRNVVVFEGKVVKIRNQGMPIVDPRSHNLNGHGDLYVEIRVQYPSSLLSKTDKAAIRDVLGKVKSWVASDNS